jgi:uncharacterized damage-inducible protein DinB
MTDIAHTFLHESRRLLRSDYLPKIERCLERLSEEDVWWRPNAASNSIGNLLLHLCGNVGQWIVGGVGQREFERHRQREFDERSPLPWRDLLAKLKATLAEADEVIRSLNSESLLERRQIQDYDVTVLEAIYHVVEHFGMHTGQIIMLSKMRTEADLKLWQPRKITTA